MNSGAFIGRTLQSIASQSHREIEVIVVDDGSVDDTPDVVSSFARRDPRIRLISRHHVGAPAARNFAASQAQGAFLAPCDSDDLWHPDKIALQLGALGAGPSSRGVAYCWSVGIDEEDAVIVHDWARNIDEGDVLYAMIANSLPGSGSSPLIRRTCFDAAGGYPEDVPNADEWQLYIALAAVCEFSVVRAHLVGYRFRRGQISSNIAAMADSLARTTRWIESRWPDTPAGVMKRRAYIVNRYLAFLAVRQGRFASAVRYRIAALRAQPAELFSLSTLDFPLMMIGRVFGLERYYYSFWRPPAIWEPARKLRNERLSPSADAPTR
ncbi:MAG: glycosyltransferase [Enhydrobacter sp.]|nr:glycosyltransferase [Enhydrobacter sp.]